MTAFCVFVEWWLKTMAIIKWNYETTEMNVTTRGIWWCAVFRWKNVKNYETSKRMHDASKTDSLVKVFSVTVVCIKSDHEFDEDCKHNVQILNSRFICFQ